MTILDTLTRPVDWIISAYRVDRNHQEQVRADLEAEFGDDAKQLMAYKASEFITALANLWLAMFPFLRGK